MNFDLKRWIPLFLVVAASGALVYLALQNPESTEAPSPQQLPPPPEIKEYVPPAKIRLPFAYDVFISTIPERPEDDELAASTTTISSKDGKKQQKEELKVYINGIIWSPVTPLVSINGKILAEGGTLGKDIKVLKIMPNKVRLKIKEQIVEKKP